MQIGLILHRLRTSSLNKCLATWHFGRHFPRSRFGVMLRALQVGRSIPVRVLHRFTKPGGHVAEIRERTVTSFKALEWLVFIDGSLTESQMFHAARLDRYQPELELRIAQFVG